MRNWDLYFVLGRQTHLFASGGSLETSYRQWLVSKEFTLVAGPPSRGVAAYGEKDGVLYAYTDVTDPSN